MLDFNLWTLNSRVFPGIDPLVVRTGDRVRIRVGNLTMTNHPIHLHGHDFEVTGTDGGWAPKSARWPEVTTDVAGRRRCAPIEFVADEPGDWALHCHKIAPHDERDGPRRADHDRRRPPRRRREDHASWCPTTWSMGERGMADMGEMEMPLPDNTLPMMTGTGPVRRRSRWAACSPSSRCATTCSAATTPTRAGTSIRRARVALRMDRRAAAARARPRRRRPKARPLQVRKPSAHGPH